MAAVAVGTFIIFVAGFIAYRAYWQNRAPADEFAVQRYGMIRLALVALALALVLGGLAERLLN